MNKITQHEKGWGWNGDVCAVFGVAIVIGATGEDPAKDRSEKESKAELIAEAFNVATETGLTPRQLAEQRAELLEALIWMVENDDTNEGDEPVESLGGESWNEYNAYWISGLNKAKAAIAKATGQEL